MRTLRASVGLGEGDGLGDSCATTLPNDNVANRAKVVFFVIPSVVKEPRVCSGWCHSFHRRGVSTSLDMTKGSSEVPPIQLREKVIAAFAVREKRFIHVARIELFPEAIEAEQVIGHALGGGMFRGPGFHEEGPIARLGEQ